MKIKPEHYEFLKAAILSIGAENIAKHRAWLQSPENPRPPKDLEMRLRHDLLHARVTSKWICDNIYPYANDAHLDTALRAIMAETVDCPPYPEDCYCHVGLDFMDGNSRVTNIQLVKKSTGTAIGIADFEQGRLYRFQIINSRWPAIRFAADAFELLANSIPQTFQKTELPA